MIYDFIVDRLKSVDSLKGNLFPTGVCIDDIYSADDSDFFFAVYTFKSRTPVRDLEGDLHHYVEEVTIDFVGKLYDQLHIRYDAVEAAFQVLNEETQTGEYIYSVTCSSPEPDAFDPDFGLLRRSMLVTIHWVPT